MLGITKKIKNKKNGTIKPINILIKSINEHFFLKYIYMKKKKMTGKNNIDVIFEEIAKKKIRPIKK
tara:strand:+ start:105 stop:302 length:198 start_codon:yes stop_codon:yes gene_type:complete